MSIIHDLDVFMKKQSDYYLVQGSNNKRMYRKKYKELEEVVYEESYNGKCLELTVPVGKVQYYSRFIEKDKKSIIEFLKNKM